METVNLFRKIAKNAVLIFCLDFAQEGEVQDVLAGSGIDGMILRPFFLSNLALAIARTRANAFSEDVQHCLGAGMDAHIAKPLDIAVLEKTLRGFSIGGRQIKPKGILN